MSYVSELLLPSYGGIPFPVQKVTIEGGLRHAVHEYIYRPGGSIEPMGRRLYQITMEAQFHATFRRWPRLMETLRDLNTLFELGTTLPLVVPQYGTMQAICTSWRRDLTATVQSGESCSFTFSEDQQQLLVAAQRPQTSATLLMTAWSDFLIAVPAAGASLDDFQSLTDLVNEIGSFGDQAELYTDQVSAKVETFQAMADTLYESNPIFEAAENAIAAQKYRSAQYQATQLKKDTEAKRKPVLVHRVSKLSSILEVSKAIYGSTDRAMELLRINDVPDPKAIPQGTSINYYPPE
ncbi:MAG: DNA circularization N-terminal domain-containing protein [Kofleriaceae bacterium]